MVNWQQKQWFTVDSNYFKAACWSYFLTGTYKNFCEGCVLYLQEKLRQKSLLPVSWLSNNNVTNLLRDLATLALLHHWIHILKTDICNTCIYDTDTSLLWYWYLTSQIILISILKILEIELSFSLYCRNCETI